MTMKIARTPKILRAQSDVLDETKDFIRFELFHCGCSKLSYKVVKSLKRIY